MDRPSANSRRIAAHIAPAAIGCLYLVWIELCPQSHRLLHRLDVLQALVAVHVFVGGLYACWLPAQLRYRVLLIVFSLLVAFFVGVATHPHAHL
jgi:hypothetical protein